MDCKLYPRVVPAMLHKSRGGFSRQPSPYRANHRMTDNEKEHIRSYGTARVSAATETKVTCAHQAPLSATGRMDRSLLARQASYQASTAQSRIKTATSKPPAYPMPPDKESAMVITNVITGMIFGMLLAGIGFTAGNPIWTALLLYSLGGSLAIMGVVVLIFILVQNPRKLASDRVDCDQAGLYGNPQLRERRQEYLGIFCSLKPILYHVRRAFQCLTVSETKMGQARYTEFMTLPCLCAILGTFVSTSYCVVRLAPFGGTARRSFCLPT